MPLQSSVRYDLAFGIPGEMRHDGPTRAQPGVVVSADATNNVFGRVFSRLKTSPNWRAGNPDGLGVEFAIMADPKLAASYGTAAAGPLAPSLTVPNNTINTMMTMGFVTVVTLSAAGLGDMVRFSNATGEIYITAPGTAADATKTDLPNAFVERFPQPSVPGLVEIRLTK